MAKGKESLAKLEAKEMKLVPKGKKKAMKAIERKEKKARPAGGGGGY